MTPLLGELGYLGVFDGEPALFPGVGTRWPPPRPAARRRAPPPPPPGSSGLGLQRQALRT